jgi:hypothetical protein
MSSAGLRRLPQRPLTWQWLARAADGHTFDQVNTEAYRNPRVEQSGRDCDPPLLLSFPCRLRPQHLTPQSSRSPAAAAARRSPQLTIARKAKPV